VSQKGETSERTYCGRHGGCNSNIVQKGGGVKQQYVGRKLWAEFWRQRGEVEQKHNECTENKV